MSNKKYCKRYHKKNYDKNIPYTLRCLVEKRITGALKFQNAKRHFEYDVLIGCDWVELQKHLEKHFKNDLMDWENRADRWQIDHKKPLFTFNLKRKKDQKKAFNYKNLQPLFQWDHAMKTTKEKRKYHGNR